MKIVFASQTGNVASFVEKLELDAIEIISGNETIEEEFVLITYTDGDGDVPYVVEEFLEENHAYLR
ncbi:MAG: class Ib ribonucleoside-diphosphate reductase assembly flavoprotein NrdI, partial [Culicoidibacterales bacterium]